MSAIHTQTEKKHIHIPLPPPRVSITKGTLYKILQTSAKIGHLKVFNLRVRASFVYRVAKKYLAGLWNLNDSKIILNEFK